MFKLAELTLESYCAEHPVSIDGENTLAWGQFMADVAATRRQVSAADQLNWALFETDTYRFAVGLLALLAEGKVVYLPAENHTGMVSSLQEEGAEFLGEFPAVSTLDILAGQVTDPPEPLDLRGKIVVFTSGSTGKPKPIAKTLRQLDAELASLEQTWGRALQQSLVVGTVSHQHLYGLLFLVLWPLCSGRCFWRKPFVDPAIMAATASRFPAATWVMSPAHLQRLDTGMPWDSVMDCTSAVFSSGGPLEQRAAQAVFEGLGQYPYEVLGSSETGGIAWRQQSAMTTPWVPLEGVEVKLDDAALAVRSCWLPDEQWYTTSDQATLDANGGFLLGVRIDRIVKVEGKRVSLPEVEAAAAGHPWIAECVVILLRRRRQTLGAVVTLTPGGAREYAAEGHHKFTREMRTYLGEHLAAAAIPRVWRVATEIPRNPQGKILQKKIDDFFDSGVLPPVLNRQDIGPHGCSLVLQIREDNPYFAGHFPKTPILPGVVQLLWAQLFAKEFLGLEGEFKGLESVKFKDVVSPQPALTLTLEYLPASGKLHYQYDSQTGRHSQGTLLYDACS